MKALSVRYEIVKSDGNWGNTRIGIELEVGEGEKAQTVLEKARLFVQANLPDPHLERRVSEAERILASPDDFTGRQVQQARQVIEGLPDDDDLPF